MSSVWVLTKYEVSSREGEQTQQDCAHKRYQGEKTELALGEYVGLDYASSPSAHVHDHGQKQANVEQQHRDANPKNDHFYARAHLTEV